MYEHAWGGIRNPGWLEQSLKSVFEVTEKLSGGLKQESVQQLGWKKQAFWLGGYDRGEVMKA